MTRNQWIAIAGAPPAMVVVGGPDASHPYARSSFDLPADSTGDRLAFAFKWLLVPGLTLLAGVVVAGRRSLIPDAIEGTRMPASHALEINLRYNQHTLEQTVRAIIAWTGLALAPLREQLTFIPVMAALFGVGRLTFRVGCLLHPLGRAFGMVLTALPTSIAFGWLIAHALDG